MDSDSSIPGKSSITSQSNIKALVRLTGTEFKHTYEKTLLLCIRLEVDCRHFRSRAC